MNKLIKVFIYLFLVLGCLSLESDLAAEDRVSQDVYVYIIAIENYEHVGRYKKLEYAKKVSAEIEKFFRNTFGLKRDINMFILHKDNLTDEEGIKQALESVKLLNDGSIVFLFFLCHGERVSAVEMGSEDLVLIASDTPPDYSGYQRLRATGVFQSLLGLGAHSVVFVVFDTCRSGAAFGSADKLGIAFRAAKRRVVSVAASSSIRDSYDFNFSQSMVSSWQSGSQECDSAGSFVKKLKVPNQTPQLLIDDPDLCFNRIGGTNACMFISNKSNGTVTLSLINKSSGKSIPYDIRAGAISFPIYFEQGMYKIGIYEDDLKELKYTTEVIDFQKEKMGSWVVDNEKIVRFRDAGMGRFGVTFFQNKNLIK